MKSIVLTLGFLTMMLLHSVPSFACSSVCKSTWIIGGGCAQWENFSCFGDPIMPDQLVIEVEIGGSQQMVLCSARYGVGNLSKMSYNVASNVTGQDLCANVINSANQGAPQDVRVSYFTDGSPSLASADCEGQGRYSSYGHDFKSAIANMQTVAREHGANGNCIFSVEDADGIGRDTWPLTYPSISVALGATQKNIWYTVSAGKDLTAEAEAQSNCNYTQNYNNQHNDSTVTPCRLVATIAATARQQCIAISYGKRTDGSNSFQVFASKREGTLDITNAAALEQCNNSGASSCVVHKGFCNTDPVGSGFTGEIWRKMNLY